ncbi:calcium-binding EF hand family protein [Actinidia rufa]|uniref:Calcium-binding EF hand family protein n=1 Tax=Actinidia rufa TaxID=165716 RepID=A0A7J0FX35_9ERIC|nr:calcium-binding EF hand family protein [Actinidia rufa]
MNLDGELDREEFVKFMQQMTAETLTTISQGLIITLAVAPTVALLTKRATEGVPGVGKVVQKLPNSVLCVPRYPRNLAFPKRGAGY